MAIVKRGFIAEGTTCESCEKLIKKQALKVNGVKRVEYSYATETGYVTYDDAKTDIYEILYKIEEKGYNCFILEESESAKKNGGWIFGILGLILIVYFALQFADTIKIPQISQNMSYGLLFVVGLITGLHCVGMCGGFVVSYTSKHAEQGTKPHKAHLMYGTGKLISYTVIGAAFGLLGSIIAFTPAMRGVAGILAGLFLVLYGLKMLNVIPSLRRIQLKTPKGLSRFVGKETRENSNPFVIGLLNGLMIACGPLQAMYIMAAGTGSLIVGAKILFIFGVGTLPIMLGFGYLLSVVSKKLTHHLLKASGAIVIILGIILVNNGLVLTGTGYDFGSVAAFVSASNTDEELTSADSAAALNGQYQEIRMEVNRYGWEPDTFVLKKDVPVKWIINGKEINGCNNAIQVPKYGLEFDIKPGEQIIEFTPTEEGVVRWSCWMGMIPGTFIVKEEGDITNAEAVQQEIKSVPLQPNGSCGGSCGSSTCGAATGGSCGCGG